MLIYNVSAAMHAKRANVIDKATRAHNAASSTHWIIIGILTRDYIQTIKNYHIYDS